MLLSTTLPSLALCLATLTSAGPATSKCTYKSYTDTFDNVTVIDGAEEIQPIGFAGGLKYTGFIFNKAIVTGTGANPPSSPNVAGAGIGSDLAQAGVVTANPFGTISTDGTSVKSFTLTEFFYSCIQIDDNSAVVNTPIGCGLEVYGFNTSGYHLPSVSLNYAPQNNVIAGMSRAVLPSYFTSLKNVTIGMATASVTPALTVLWLDNVVHSNCY